MKILIVGSQGFIGSHLVTFLLGKDHKVTGCDLVEHSAINYEYHKISILSPDFDSLFGESTFDICINASGSGNVSYSISHPFSDFEANAIAVAKVLDTIRKYQPSCKYVHISSAAVYGNPARLPISETDLPLPLSPYGYHKWVSEIICREYFQLYKLPIAIVRPFSVYGPGLKKQLLWDICKKLEHADSINLFGTGNESRDFIHVDDLCEIIHLIIQKSNFEADVYNGAIGVETTIKKIAELFEQNFPGKKKIKFSGEVKKGDPINWRADTSSINTLGFHPVTTLEKGLPQYIDWFQLHKDAI